MDDIRSWWEVPCIAHFCHIFAKPFKLVNFEIEELEDTLLLDEVKDKSTPSLLVNLYCSLLNGIVDKEVTEENWEFFLKMHLQWRNDNLDEGWNPHRDKIYKDLDTRTKVEILHRLIHWRLELDDVGDLLRGIDPLTLRVNSIGKDEDGNIYWYFYGTNLYLETPKKKPQKKTKQEQGGGKGRGKGKPPPKDASHTEGDGEEQGGVWKLVCSTMEEWDELVDDLSNCRRGEGKKLYNYINNELLPDVMYNLQQKEKIFKKKLLAEMPRRTSDRLAQKAILREEEIMEASIRETQREEQRKLEAEEQAIREEEAERKHRVKMEEIMKKRKAKEEEQAKQRQEEEKNWSLAMSGELSGPRQAALGAVQGVVETQHLIDVDDKDEVLHTAMYKVISGLRRHEDGWVFEEPVSEDIAPGYFDVVEIPMDFQTVEKNVEAGLYTTKEKVRKCLSYYIYIDTGLCEILLVLQFVKDMELIFANCKAYNGEDSEYGELADEMLKNFQSLMTEHFIDEILNKDEEEEGRSRKKKNHSPSPELTSESSEESEEDEEDLEDENEDGVKKKGPRKPKGMHSFKPMMEGMMVRPNMVMNPQRMYAPHPMMQHNMRPLPPSDMMGYPPQYGPYGPYPPHPMAMRPHPPRDMFYPPDMYQRYPYPPPPPYRQMYMPEHSMPHPMTRPPGGPYPQSNGPVGGAEHKEKLGQRVSSPRVSSTVQTPPTSGDERNEEGEDKQRAVNQNEEPPTSQQSQNPPGQQSQPHPPSFETPRPPSDQMSRPLSSQPPPHPPSQGSSAQPRPTMNQPHPAMNQPHPHYPQPHPDWQQYHHHMMRNAHMMNDQRYHQAMMAQQRRQMMGAGGGYPPPHYPPSEHTWNGQRMPYPPGPPPPGGYTPQQQHQLAMMERQRRYYEYQMKMRMRGPTPPTAPNKPTGDKGDEQQKPSENEDVPDYYDSLTTYAMGLAKGANEEKPSGNGTVEQTPAKEDQEETKTDDNDDEKSVTNGNDSNHQANVVPNNEQKNDKIQSGTPPLKTSSQSQHHHSPHPSHWPPHPYHHMMANGYNNQMMSHSPYPPPGMPPPHGMYGGPHPSQMPYPSPDGSGMYGSPGGGPGGYMSPEWQYMEMQRQQWLMHQQQLHHKRASQTPPTKRPHPPDATTTPPKDASLHDEPPPSKQMKTTEAIVPPQQEVPNQNGVNPSNQDSSS
jgi:hypothetical protein